MKNMDQLSLQGALNRRSFLKLSGILGVGVASTGLVPLTAEAVRFNRKQYKISKTRLAMGTVVSMTLIHTSRDKAEKAMDLAFDEIDRLTGLMSRFDNATAVALLNLRRWRKWSTVLCSTTKSAGEPLILRSSLL